MARKRAKVTLDKKTIFIIVSLVAIFVLAYVLRYIPYMRYDTRLLVNWADDWWFLGMARYFATYQTIPEVEPTYGNGIDYLYPPGLMLLFAVMTQLTGVELVYLGRFVAIGLGSFTAVLVYALTKKLTGDYRVGLLSALLTVTSIRYLPRSSGFCAELMGHLLIPITLLFVYLSLKKENKMYLIVSGIMLGGLILAHHLSGAVFLIVLSFFSFLMLVVGRKKSFPDIGKVLVIVSIGFVVSSLFWLNLLEKGIMNIVVKEAYGRSGGIGINAFLGYMGIPQFILGVGGILLALRFRKTKHLMLLGWVIPTFFGLWDRTIAKELFKNTLLKGNPDLIYLFSPSLYTRYYDFMAQPLAILAAIFAFYVFLQLSKIKRLKKSIVPIGMIGLFLIVVTMPLPFNEKLYKVGGYRWLSFAMTSYVDPEEYDAAVWMRENIPDDVNILSDYEANEMILGVTAKTVANGGTLRATLPVGTIYTDHLTIYATEDLQESLELIEKYKITHIFLSERMIDKAWFAVERNVRFDYEYGSSIRDTGWDKFDSSNYFEKIYDQNKVKIYEVINQTP